MQSESRISISTDTINRLELSATDLNIAEQVISVGLVRIAQLNKKVLHADETELQVLKEDGRTAANKSYLRLYHSGRDGPPQVIFDYQTTRASKHPICFLTGFEGYLHVDGYPGCNSIPKVVLVGCWLSPAVNSTRR